MNKISIRLTSFLLAIFSYVLIFQNIVSNQEQIPLNTNEQFEINIANTLITKEELALELDKIVDTNNAALIKIATPTNDYENKKDIIYFGSKKPISNDLVVTGNKINWLDAKLTGELISSKNIGSRPLYGTYATDNNADFKHDIEQWAIENGIDIEWTATPSLLKDIYYNLVHNGVGNVILTAFLLFISSMIAWFVLRAKGRSIRLLGGVELNKIYKEDTLAISKLFIPSYITALFIFLLYIGVSRGIRQIPLVVTNSLIILVVLTVISLVVTYGMSIIVKPKSEHIAKRIIPLKRFKQLSVGTRIISIILALLIVPSTITSAYVLQQLSHEYSLWENMQSNVSLSFGDLDSLETEKMRQHVEKFFKTMEKNNNLSLSLVIDKSIELNKEEYGGYDHIIITDRSWINSFNIGIEKNGKGGKLTKIELNALDKPLQDFLTAQMPLWTKTQEVQPKGVEFYEFIGKNFLGLPPNVGSGGSTVQATNPLIILIDSPSEILDILGFTLPACSSGNVVFPNEQLLRTELNKSPIKEFVISIDTIADVALAQAQKFEKEAIFYIVACILIFISMVFAGILTAQLWVNENKKRIFTLHTFGKSYKEIIMPNFIKECCVAILTIFVGAIISFVIRRPDIITVIIVSIAILILYSLSSFIAYHICTRQAFYRVATRND